MDINYSKILNFLPHRYPFLLVDKVIDILENEKATGIKNITLNEQVFQGHFPDDPIFPGVLIIEAMAQTAAILALVSLSENINPSPSIYFMTIDNVKFRKPVRPGDTLYMKIVKIQSHTHVWKFSAEAFVENQRVSEASFMAMIKFPQ